MIPLSLSFLFFLFVFLSFFFLIFLASLFPVLLRRPPRHCETLFELLPLVLFVVD